MTRYDFGAIAEVIDLDSRDDMIVVTRDLSLSGCFVKTRTPFAAGTEVRVRIAYAGADFAALGSVTQNITRDGMGIEFVEIEPRDRAIIEKWLGVSALDASKARDGARVRNRLTRQEHMPRVTSADRSPKSGQPLLVPDEACEPARNLGKIRDGAGR
jgi:PilZ domain-containing protein